MNDASRLQEVSVPEPILITGNGVVLAGFGVWRFAVLNGWLAVNCIEYPLTEDESLLFILTHHRTRCGWNAFVRIRLALTLEPDLRKRALDNMRAGGKYKGSSNLTEAERVDVTVQIAEAADVSVGNISKVKQLLSTAIPELLRALRGGEISIHKAWLLSKKPPTIQREDVALPDCKRNIKKEMRTLASRHGSRSPETVPDPSSVIRQLSALESRKHGSFRVFVSNVRGKAVCLTKELLLELDAQQELLPDAEESVAKADLGSHTPLLGS